MFDLGVCVCSPSLSLPLSLAGLVFVETLDKCFESVCELDLIFNSDKVHFILDEIVQGGMVLETSVPRIIDSITEQTLLSNGKGAPGVRR